MSGSPNWRHYGTIGVYAAASRAAGRSWTPTRSGRSMSAMAQTAAEPHRRRVARQRDINRRGVTAARSILVGQRDSGTAR